MKAFKEFLLYILIALGYQVSYSVNDELGFLAWFICFLPLMVLTVRIIERSNVADELFARKKRKGKVFITFDMACVGHDHSVYSVWEKGDDGVLKMVDFKSTKKPHDNGDIPQN